VNGNEHAAEIRRGIARALEALIAQTGLGRVARMEITGHVFGNMTPHDGPAPSDGELTTLLDHYRDAARVVRHRAAVHTHRVARDQTHRLQLAKLAGQKGQVTKMEIKLGDEVKDKISGYTGIVTGRIDYLHCSPQLRVQTPALHEGKPVESMWFEYNAVERVGG
jgi:hypothetical protein